MKKENKAVSCSCPPYNGPFEDSCKPIKSRWRNITKEELEEFKSRKYVYPVPNK